MVKLVCNEDIRLVAIENPRHLQQMLLYTVQGLIEGTITEKLGNAICRASETLLKAQEKHENTLRLVIEEQRRQTDSATPLRLAHRK